MMTIKRERKTSLFPFFLLLLSLKYTANASSSSSSSSKANNNNNIYLRLNLLETFRGELEPDQHRSFVVDNGPPTNLKLELVSLEGDCDLYALENDAHLKINTHRDFSLKTFNYDSNEYVYIGDSMRRPISIAIHAHPYRHKCKYELRKYRIELIGESKLDARRTSLLASAVCRILTSVSAELPACQWWSEPDFVLMNQSNRDNLLFHLPHLEKSFSLIDASTSADYAALSKNESILATEFDGDDNESIDDNDTDKEERRRQQQQQQRGGEEEEEEEEKAESEDEDYESVIWTVFIKLIELIAEILFS